MTAPAIEPTVIDAPRRRRKISADRSTPGVAFWFLLPSLIGFLTFYLYPTIRGFYLSLTDWNLVSNSGEYIGFENYAKLVEDPLVTNAIKVTLLYVVLNIGIQTVLATGIAVMLDRLIKSTLVKAIVVLPWLIPNVIVALLWMWMLDRNLGAVNLILGWIDVGPFAFLGDPDLVIPSLAGINVWRHMGYTALLIFAGLQTIPGSLYEAAAVDGATEWKMFRKITLPLLRPIMALVLVITVLGSFQVFDTVITATGGFASRPGGPINASRVIYLYIYELAFQRFQMGYAATVAVALFAILLVVTIIQFRILRANESDLAA